MFPFLLGVARQQQAVKNWAQVRGKPFNTGTIEAYAAIYGTIPASYGGTSSSKVTPSPTAKTRGSSQTFKRYARGFDLADITSRNSFKNKLKTDIAEAEQTLARLTARNLQGSTSLDFNEDKSIKAQQIAEKRLYTLRKFYNTAFPNRSIATRRNTQDAYRWQKHKPDITPRGTVKATLKHGQVVQSFVSSEILDAAGLHGEGNIVLSYKDIVNMSRDKINLEGLAITSSDEWNSTIRNIMEDVFHFGDNTGIHSAAVSSRAESARRIHESLQGIAGESLRNLNKDSRRVIIQFPPSMSRGKKTEVTLSELITQALEAHSTSAEASVGAAMHEQRVIRQRIRAIQKTLQLRTTNATDSKRLHDELYELLGSRRFESLKGGDVKIASSVRRGQGIHFGRRSASVRNITDLNSELKSLITNRSNAVSVLRAWAEDPNTKEGSGIDPRIMSEQDRFVQAIDKLREPDIAEETLIKARNRAIGRRKSFLQAVRLGIDPDIQGSSVLLDIPGRGRSRLSILEAGAQLPGLDDGVSHSASFVISPAGFRMHNMAIFGGEIDSRRNPILSVFDSLQTNLLRKHNILGADLESARGITGSVETAMNTTLGQISQQIKNKLGSTQTAQDMFLLSQVTNKPFSNLYTAKDLDVLRHITGHSMRGDQSRILSFASEEIQAKYANNALSVKQLSAMAATHPELANIWKDKRVEDVAAEIISRLLYGDNKQKYAAKKALNAAFKNSTPFSNALKKIIAESNNVDIKELKINNVVSIINNSFSRMAGIDPKFSTFRKVEGEIGGQISRLNKIERSRAMAANGVLDNIEDTFDGLDEFGDIGLKERKARMGNRPFEFVEDYMQRVIGRRRGASQNVFMREDGFNPFSFLLKDGQDTSHLGVQKAIRKHYQALGHSEDAADQFINSVNDSIRMYSTADSNLAQQYDMLARQIADAGGTVNPDYLWSVVKANNAHDWAGRTIARGKIEEHALEMYNMPDVKSEIERTLYHKEKITRGQIRKARAEGKPLKVSPRRMRSELSITHTPKRIEDIFKLILGDDEKAELLTDAIYNPESHAQYGPRAKMYEMMINDQMAHEMWVPGSVEHGVEGMMLPIKMTTVKQGSIGIVDGRSRFLEDTEGIADYIVSDITYNGSFSENQQAVARFIMQENPNMSYADALVEAGNRLSAGLNSERKLFAYRSLSAPDPDSTSVEQLLARAKKIGAVGKTSRKNWTAEELIGKINAHTISPEVTRDFWINHARETTPTKELVAKARRELGTGATVAEINAYVEDKIIAIGEQLAEQNPPKGLKLALEGYGSYVSVDDPLGITASRVDMAYAENMRLESAAALSGSEKAAKRHVENMAILEQSIDGRGLVSLNGKNFNPNLSVLKASTEYDEVFSILKGKLEARGVDMRRLQHLSTLMESGSEGLEIAGVQFAELFDDLTRRGDIDIAQVMPTILKPRSHNSKTILRGPLSAETPIMIKGVSRYEQRQSLSRIMDAAVVLRRFEKEPEENIAKGIISVADDRTDKVFYGGFFDSEGVMATSIPDDLITRKLDGTGAGLAVKSDLNRLKQQMGESGYTFRRIKGASTIQKYGLSGVTASFNSDGLLIPKKIKMSESLLEDAAEALFEFDKNIINKTIIDADGSMHSPFFDALSADAKESHVLWAAQNTPEGFHSADGPAPLSFMQDTLDRLMGQGRITSQSNGTFQVAQDAADGIVHGSAQAARDYVAQRGTGGGGNVPWANVVSTIRGSRTGRIGVAAGAGLLALGLIRTIRKRDHTEEDIQGPQYMPGGTPYSTPVLRAAYAPGGYDQGQSSQGRTYVMQGRGSKGTDHKGFSNSVKAVIGGSMSSTLYGTPSAPTRGNQNQNVIDLVGAYS